MILFRVYNNIAHNIVMYMYIHIGVTVSVLTLAKDQVPWCGNDLTDL